MSAATGLHVISENEELQMHKQQAESDFNIISRIVQFHKRKWVNLGRSALRLSEGGYKLIRSKAGEPYEGFDQMIDTEFDSGRSTIYRAKGLVEKIGCLPDDVLRKISECNAVMLCKLSDHERVSEDWIVRAQTMKQDEFEELVRDHDPTLEKQRTVSIKLDESLAKKWEQTKKVVMWLVETEDERIALEYMLTHILESPWADEANLKKNVPLSNLQAWQRRNKKEKREQVQ